MALGVVMKLMAMTCLKLWRDIWKGRPLPDTAMKKCCGW